MRIFESSSPNAVKRIYEYRGFEVAVELESVPDGFDVVVVPGFIAVVQIQTVGGNCRVVPALRLGMACHKPFPTRAEALIAGYSAGQRIVDDTLT